MVEVARLFRLDNGSALKAFADISIAGQVLVKGVRVVEGKDGNLFVAMFQQQGKDGRWHETVTLLNDEFKESLQEIVLEAFNA